MTFDSSRIVQYLTFEL